MDSHVNEQRRNSPAKVALVTGSASGIGANIAVDLVHEGYNVVVTGRDIKKLKEVVQLCNAKVEINYNQAVYFQVDLCDLCQVDKLVDFVKGKFARIDLLVNNACWRGEAKSILDADTLDDFRKVMHMNVFIPFYLIHKCFLLDNIESSKEAVIINISSVASQAVVPLHLYSISKACLSEVARQISLLRSDERYKGISSITISPGPVLTDERPHHQAMSKLTLLKRVGSTQEISNLVMFVLKNAQLFDGQELNIDGGYLSRQIK